ncbi:MAG: DUF3450 domain-containing protein [Pseudomonadales bacterium]|nr:DUF3450 domain-containing protein [Pseudomonadales bacterium]
MANRIAHFLLCSTVICMPAIAANSDQLLLEQSVKTSHKTSVLAQKSQVKIDRLASDSRQLLEEYRRLLQQGEYQRAYNDELVVLEQEQLLDIASLKQQIADIKITQQRLLPLLREVTDTLAQFIQLDLPFQQSQRLESVEKLRALLASSQVPMAEKFRRVMELYQTENDYNYDIASYRDIVLIDDKSLSVEILRIGRSALYYQTLDHKKSALWQGDNNSWQALDKKYNLDIRKAIRVANKDVAPNLLSLPVALTSSSQENK